ncbi:hypothetical protein F5Y19DRAFT_147667 [Xylariaceae sp. FL1651]|nr:hypothetical protein F5Y19DRAFT_147667 [Xylariaceae sp. FL1651]
MVQLAWLDVPASVILLLILILRHHLYLPIFIDTVNILGVAFNILFACVHFLRQLLILLPRLPFRICEVIVDIFLTETRSGDTPFPLFFLRFWHGFLVGLVRCFVHFGGDISVRRPAPRQGGIRLADEGHDGQQGIDERNEQDEAIVAEPPRPLLREFRNGWTYLRSALLCFAVLSLLWLGLYHLCYIFLGYDWAASYNGEQCLTCLPDDEAFREAMAEAKKPLRYRFFGDGTRILFPER